MYITNNKSSTFDHNEFVFKVSKDESATKEEAKPEEKVEEKISEEKGIIQILFEFCLFYYHDEN